MAKVSVIIAAYNKEEYIAECIESVLAQTLEDVEAVVVNDASVDKTLEIAQKLQKLDSRVKIVDEKENQGTLRTRKNGFLASTGEYIMYLDADDSLTSDACEKAYNAIIKSGTDVVQFDIDVITEEPEKYKNQIEEMRKNTFSFVKHKIVTANEGGLMGLDPAKNKISLTYCNKIYKREIIEKTEADMPDTYMVMAEDWTFSFVALANCHSYDYIEDRLYQYNFGCGVSTSRELPESKMNALAKMYFGYQCLTEWAQKHNAAEECRKKLEQMQDIWLDGIVWNCMVECPRSKRTYFLEQIFRYCPIEDFLAYVSCMLHAKRILNSADTAKALAGQPMFQTTKKQIRTIGVFYFRVYNGGIENAISNLMNMWVKNGYNVVLFTDEKPNSKDYYIDPSVKRVVLPKIEKEEYCFYWKRINTWRKALSEYQVDAVVYNAWLNPILLDDALAIKSTGTLLIAHTHGMFCSDMDALGGNYAYTNLETHQYYKLTDMVVTLSKTDKTYWQSFGLRCMTTVNPIAIDLSVQTAPLNGKNLLFVGRISYEKQIIDLFKILLKVQKTVPDAKLTIVGATEDKPYEEMVNRFIKENKLENSVEMVGFTNNVLPYYQKSDVMLCTSKFEGFCLTIAESKICGLPLVSYELPNLDFIRENKGMFVVEQNDIEAAAQHVVELLTNDELRLQMGQEARKSAEKLFSLDLKAHWDHIFEEALTPHDKEILCCKRPELETVIQLLNEYNARGILRRIDIGDSVNAGELLNYQLQCNALDATIKEIRSSTSYRIGRAITAIPGVFVNLFRRLFGKKKKEEQ